MLYMVTGGSASGKSEYAERLAAERVRGGAYDGLYYIAAMYPCDDECVKRIERHRQMRAGGGFQTIECHTGLSRLSFGRGDVLLLECMSNLLANEMYLPQGAVRQRGTAAAAAVDAVIVRPLLELREMAGELIVVTNEVFSDGVVCDEETDTYLRLLGHINRELARRADCVVEVVCGIPVCQKGEKTCCNH